MTFLVKIEKQVFKYNSANPIVKKFVEDDVRKKIGA